VFASTRCRCVTVLAFCAGSAQALDLCIASWNTQSLGWNNNKAYAALGRIGPAFDFIAVRELMNERGAQAFLSALEEASGVV